MQGKVTRGIIVPLIGMMGGALFAQGGGPGTSGGGNGSGGSGSGGPAPTAQQVALFVPNESAPPGGVVQMKFMVTEPVPISTGRPISSFDSSVFDDVLGIELFNPSGDVNGVALINQNRVSISYIASTGAQGTDYPIMTLALHISPNAVPGTQTLFSLDPSSNWTLGDLGTATMKPEPPATVSVGGSISITNVVPGGGILPAGSVVRIEGVGFQPKTQVQLNAIKFSSIQVVSPNEIQVTLAQQTNMTGQKIQVVNPDGSQDTYFSYLRGLPYGASDQLLLVNALPIFSAQMYSAATFSPVVPAVTSEFTGIALQNSQTGAADITVSLYSAAGALLGSSTTTLPSGYRMMRDIEELVEGASPSADSYLVVTASQPIQVFGFTGDYATGAVTPFTAIATRP